MAKKTKDQIMAKDHYAIVTNVTTYHEGDERSRTNPGHGYPAHTTTESVYIPFETSDELLDEIRTNKRWSREPYQLIRASPVRVRTTLSLERGTQ